MIQFLLEIAQIRKLLIERSHGAGQKTKTQGENTIDDQRFPGLEQSMVPRRAELTATYQVEFVALIRRAVDHRDNRSTGLSQLFQKGNTR